MVIANTLSDPISSSVFTTFFLFPQVDQRLFSFKLKIACADRKREEIPNARQHIGSERRARRCKGTGLTSAALHSAAAPGPSAARRPGLAGESSVTLLHPSSAFRRCFSRDGDVSKNRNPITGMGEPFGPGW